MVNMFGQWLLDTMDRKGVKQYELAERIGVSPTRISHFVNGNGTPSIPNLVRICDVLDVEDVTEPAKFIYEDDIRRICCYEKYRKKEAL